MESGIGMMSGSVYIDSDQLSGVVFKVEGNEFMQGNPFGIASMKSVNDFHG